MSTETNLNRAWLKAEIAADPIGFYNWMQNWEALNMPYAQAGTKDAGLSRVTSPERALELLRTVRMIVPKEILPLAEDLLELYGDLEFYPKDVKGVLSRLACKRFRYLWDPDNKNPTGHPPQIREPTADLISWTEMAVASWISMTCEVDNINDGARGNNAERAPDGTYAKTAFLFYGVGSRFELSNVLDSLVLLKKEPNKAEVNIYDCTEPQTEAEVDRENFLRNWVRTKMIGALKQSPYYSWWTDEQIDELPPLRTIEPRLYLTKMAMVYRANLMAARQKNSLVNLPGYGLGAWGVEGAQSNYNLCAIMEVLKRFDWSCVHTVIVSWFPYHAFVVPESIIDANGHKIVLIENCKNPLIPIETEELDPRPVVGVAWDGGSWIGNEFWQAYLASSSDPALSASGSALPTLTPVNPWFVDPEIIVF